MTDTRHINMRKPKDLVKQVVHVNDSFTGTTDTRLNMYSIGFMHGVLYAMGIDKQDIPDNETAFMRLIKELQDQEK